MVKMCSFRKYMYPYSPHRRDWTFPGVGVGGSLRPTNLKKCRKLNWNFQRGGDGGLPQGRYGYFLELHNTLALKLVAENSSAAKRHTLFHRYMNS